MKTCYEKRDSSFYPRVHKDEIHLHECENHLEKWIQTPQNVIAAGG